MDQGQELPAQPCAQRCKELEIPIAHALFASDEAECVKHEPEAYIARSGADDGVSRGYGHWAAQEGTYDHSRQ